jgi:hypothetical protein
VGRLKGRMLCFWRHVMQLSSFEHTTHK